MPSGTLKRVWVVLVVLGGLFVAILAMNRALSENDLEKLLSGGELVLITRNNAACYYEGANGPTGFEYELAKAFTDYLGVTLRVLVIEDERDMIAALEKGLGHIVAAGFPFGNRPAKGIWLGPGYHDVDQIVIGRRGGVDIKSKKDLEKTTLWMTYHSARIEYLEALRRIFPKISWKILTTYTSDDLLQMVWSRALPVAIVDSTIMYRNHPFFPELLKLLTLGAPRKLRWATSPDRCYLNLAIHDWFERKETREVVDGLRDYFYGHLETFDYVDIARYRRRIRNRLPYYRDLFEAAAKRYHVDWKLLAAVGYQESHWNPSAKSYTGVRGMMMLTLETAETLGVEDRLDVESTIMAGARYIARLKRQVGDDVAEPDRTWIALSAYNVGFSHVEDARILARRLGKQPDTWQGIRFVLPLLQQKKYYNTLANRYARGREAVVFVDRIRTYYRILQQVDAKPGQGGRIDDLPRH